MSSEEEESDFSASDEEGGEQIIQIIDNKSDQSQNEDEDGSNDEDGKIQKKLEELVWTNKLPAQKGKKKDRCPRAKLANGFKPSTVMDCFNRFMTPAVKELILKYSNLKGRRESEEDGSEFKDFDMDEIDCLIGLMIANGVSRQTRIPFDKLWSDSMLVPSIFSTAISRDRMREMKKHLRFDDKKERETRLGNDRLAAVREVYELIVKQFKTSYHPSPNLTIDERISPFRGKVKFRTYMPQKPHKYGIKEWVCADASNFYVVSFEIYSGQKDNQREVNQGENVVMNLTSHLDYGYNITTDNFFTSIPLALKLLSRKNPMTLLGTLKNNRKYVPDLIKKHAKELKELYSSKFAFSKEIMLVSYQCKKNKAVVILSSSEPNDRIMKLTKGQKRNDKSQKDDQKKPEVIDMYNHTKYGVDIVDGMTQIMSCVRGTRRWTVNIFLNMLDMICLNSYICYRIAIDPKIERRDFMDQLVKHLIEANSVRRLSIPFIPTYIKSNIRKLYPHAQTLVDSTDKGPKPRRTERCDLCTGNYDSRKFATRYCSSCNRKVCVKHQKPVICTDCP